MQKLSFFLLALTLICASCKKDNNTVGDGQGYFNCKVDGKDYKVSGLLAYATDFSNEFGIYGLTGDGYQETCFITVPHGLGKGTHTFDNNTRGNFTDASQNDYSSLWGQGSGSITIDEIDAKHVAGSFQFIAYDGNTETTKKTITEGKFNVDFR